MFTISGWAFWRWNDIDMFELIRRYVDVALKQLFYSHSNFRVREFFTWKILGSFIVKARRQLISRKNIFTEAQSFTVKIRYVQQHFDRSITFLRKNPTGQENILVNLTNLANYSGSCCEHLKMSILRICHNTERSAKLPD